ncbi:class I SAM-dependent methyltransferase [Streptomyces sp. 150FB]|uniref:class I SAM-dependent methyltransferase n=1 Tax=Streptomyces sp. 150FB TaxID=1576605 RepID=UPI000698DB83|nr:class I SAM-dependent methyltransferase [Streptomyces sp. 150FB]
MNPEFYSKVAGKFGGYSSGAERTTEFTNGDPEVVFDGIAKSESGAGRSLLDVGCADGRNLLTIAPDFARVHAIDMSAEMLDSARAHQGDSGLAHVRFEQRDAARTGFSDGEFDLVTSRRGPLFVPEFRRVLKDGGSIVYLGIGEQDVRKLKETFGRGQLYGRWEGTPVAQEDRKQLEEEGFEILKEEHFPYDEYFHSPADLNRFLEMVPIFEDYDSVKDRDLFESYVEQESSDKGVHLARHWFLLHARKVAS